ncbi:hypothetical protein DQ04_00131230 [Trypanosoma grayi]|uniref:hypothetical protein n=1 Tax=Trypanosoma grayi TaxID=71804 RepID=UPI0004F4B01F|nr:hypothetical protein DQ04_00131230 [Trypanosoma grayi]KEG15264.1 hypothetical protein DQ04_00131230 [Trypanosoma grayi]
MRITRVTKFARNDFLADSTLVDSFVTGESVLRAATPPMSVSTAAAEGHGLSHLCCAERNLRIAATHVVFLDHVAIPPIIRAILRISAQIVLFLLKRGVTRTET